MIPLLFSCQVDPVPHEEEDPAPEETTEPEVLDLKLGPLSFSGPVPTNLLVISLDTARLDRLGAFGGGDTTPALDQVLAESFVFTEHRSCGNWTVPSTVCLQTGVHPLKQGFWPWNTGMDVIDLPALETLQSHLGQMGFDTRLVTANPFFSNIAGVGNDFSEVVRHDWSRASSVVTSGLELADTLVEPWYLHLHFTDPHQPYNPPTGYQPTLEIDRVGLDLSTNEGLEEANKVWDKASEAWQRAVLEQVDSLYQGELRYWDDRFAVLWEDLDQRGLLEDTLVVFWTDHGEQLRERGIINHGAKLYVEETRALMAFWARNLEPGSWAGATSHIDLLPTLAGIYGFEVNSDGIALGTGGEEHLVAMGQYGPDAGPLRLSMANAESQLFYLWDGEKHFHHTGSDPTQETDVYDVLTVEVETMWQSLMPWVERVIETRPDLGEPVSPGL